MNKYTMLIRWIALLTLLTYRNIAPAAVIDDFNFGDGTPINITSTGNFETAADVGLPGNNTVGNTRVGNARAFITSDRIHLSVNSSVDNSVGVARIEGVATSSAGGNGPGVSLIWDGATNPFTNDDVFMSPLDLTQNNAFKLQFASTSGEIQVHVILGSGQDVGVYAISPTKTISGPSALVIPFSELVPSPFSGQTEVAFLADVGFISLSFRAREAGIFDVRLDSFETVFIPEPSAISLLALGLIGLLQLRYRFR